jgi:hypothetical protein
VFSAIFDILLPHPKPIDSSPMVVAQYTDTKPPIPFYFLQTPEHHHEDYSHQSWHISVEAEIPDPKTFAHAESSSLVVHQ